MHRLRLWLIAGVGTAVIAGAVLYVSERQRATTDTNFSEARTASSLQVELLSAERSLDAYAALGQQKSLKAVYAGESALASDLARARELSSDDAIETRDVAAQTASFRRWQQLALATIRRQESAHQDDRPLQERARGRLIETFIAQNERYQERLLANRHREERAAALLPVWVMLGLAAIVLVLAAAVSIRQGRALDRKEELERLQRGFAEAIQFAENEAEAHQLLVGHLEHVLPNSDVLVLNRNNSFDRLEPSREVQPDDPRHEPLANAQPRSCLAVRLSRRYDRTQGGENEVFGCAICGALPGPSICDPLLV
jgi:hypothetical protein